jgi:hypothetical protein
VAAISGWAVCGCAKLSAAQIRAGARNILGKEVFRGCSSQSQVPSAKGEVGCTSSEGSALVPILFAGELTPENATLEATYGYLLHFTSNRLVTFDWSCCLYASPQVCYIRYRPF